MGILACGFTELGSSVNPQARMPMGVKLMGKAFPGFVFPPGGSSPAAVREASAENS